MNLGEFRIRWPREEEKEYDPSYGFRYDQPGDEHGTVVSQKNEKKALKASCDALSIKDR